MIIQVGHLNGEVKLYNLAEQCVANDLLSILQSEYATDVQLISSGSQVSAASLLAPEQVYYVTVDADGGKKKKKKKKNWATKKKIKHRHRKIKLATLKIYSVSGDTVKRDRKQCPSCPKGVYMAKHFDRHYCGTCHQTIKMDEATIKANLEALRKQQKDKLAAVPAKDAAPAGKGGKAAKKEDKKAAKKK